MHFGVLQSSFGAVDVEHGAGVVGGPDPAGGRLSVAELDLDQSAGVAAPVAREGERSVDPGRGDLEGVGLLTHQVGLVEHARDLAGGIGDVVHRDAAVLVDGDSEDTALAGTGEVDRFEVEPQLADRAGQLLSEAIPGVCHCHGSGPPLLCCCGETTLTRRPAFSDQAERCPLDGQVRGAARCAPLITHAGLRSVHPTKSLAPLSIPQGPRRATARAERRSHARTLGLTHLGFPPWSTSPPPAARSRAETRPPGAR